MGGASYTKIPGSEALRTKKRGASPVAKVEAADRASLARVDIEVGGSVVSVGRVVLQGPAVPLLLDVVDRLLPLLEAEELAIYVHLYRLAVAEEKNVCRISRAELSRRTRLADRRLGRALAGLVEKKAVSLIDRDRDGTLYRVHFLDEQRVAAAAAPAPAPAPEAGTEARHHMSIRSVGDVCSWFSSTFGTSPGRSGADVAALVLELLEEGHTFAKIPALIEAFVAKAPKTTPLRDFSRY